MTPITPGTTSTLGDRVRELVHHLHDDSRMREASLRLAQQLERDLQEQGVGIGAEGAVHVRTR